MVLVWLCQVESIDHMLREHNVSRACFAGHSEPLLFVLQSLFGLSFCSAVGFGSVCVSWIVQHRPELVDSLVLLDPVTSVAVFG